MSVEQEILIACGHRQYLYFWMGGLMHRYDINSGIVYYLRRYNHTWIEMPKDIFSIEYENMDELYL